MRAPYKINQFRLLIYPQTLLGALTAPFYEYKRISRISMFNHGVSSCLGILHKCSGGGGGSSSSSSSSRFV